MQSTLGLDSRVAIAQQWDCLLYDTQKGNIRFIVQSRIEVFLKNILIKLAAK